MKPAEIRKAYITEAKIRRRYWIAGVPTKDDLRALRRHIAHACNTDEVSVEEAVNEIPQMHRVMCSKS